MNNPNYDIVLINPNPYTAKGINDTTFQQPLSVLYPATLLKNNGHKCKVLDAKVLGLSNNQILKKVIQWKTKIIGVSLMAVSYNSVKQLIALIKRYKPEIQIILGGPHPSSLPELVLKDMKPDAVVIGEGEYTLLEIAERLKQNKPLFKGIKGIAYWKNNKIIFNKKREVNKNLDELPFPDHSMLPNPKLYKRRVKKSPAVPILTSRGCPFRCTYCSRDIYGKGFTFRSPENVVAEIEYLVKKFGFKQIDIVDDNMMVNKERAIKIFEKLIEKNIKVAINLQSGVRVNSIDKKILKLMKKAGVFRVAFGIESGDQGILKRIKKDINFEDIKKAVTLTKKAGIRADCFFMVGLPGDNAKSMQRTINFAKRLKPNTANFSMTLPFPGTELYDEISNSGQLFTETKYGLDTGYNIAAVNYILPHMNKNEIKRYYKKAYQDFYLRPSQIIRMLSDIKSYDEFIWLIETGIGVFRTILLKS